MRYVYYIAKYMLCYKLYIICYMLILTLDTYFNSCISKGKNYVSVVHGFEYR